MERREIFAHYYNDLKSRVVKLLSRRAVSRRCLVLNFGEKNVQMLWMKSVQGKDEVLSYACWDLDPRGEQDRMELERQIREVVDRCDLPEKKVLISCSADCQFEVRRMVLPRMPESELMEASRWQLKDEFSFDLEEVWLDWQVLREFCDDDGEHKMEVVFAVVPKATVSDYLQIAESCGMIPEGLTIADYNFGELVSSMQTVRSEAVVILHIGDDYSTVSLLKQGKICFVRRMAVSGSSFVQALTKTIVTETGKIQLSLQQAQELIAIDGIPLSEQHKVLEGLPAAQIFSLVRPVVEMLLREIRFSIHYFITQIPQSQFSHLYLAGRAAVIENFETYLERELGLAAQRVRIPDLPVGYENQPKECRQDDYDLANIVGAFMGRGHSLNLIRTQAQRNRQRQIRSSVFQYGVIGLGLLLLILISIVPLRTEIWARKSRTRSDYFHELKPLEELNKIIAEKRYLAAALSDGVLSSVAVLRLVSECIPDQVILSDLFFEEDQARLVLEGAFFRAEGMDSALTEFMRRLEASLGVKDVQLVMSRKDGPKEIFEIVCELVR